MRLLLPISILLLAVGWGCGDAEEAGKPNRSPTPTSIRSWEHQLDNLHDLIGGSPRERAAGELVLFHRQQDPFTACMRARGVDYTPPAWADMWRLRDSRGLAASASLFLEPIDDPDFPVRVERAEAEAQRETGRDEGRSAAPTRRLAPPPRPAGTPPSSTVTRGGRAPRAGIRPSATSRS